MDRVLAVDDEERIRNLIRKYAEFEGFEIREAASGEEALEILADESFDAIVLDIMLPGKDGFEVLKEIRGMSEVPVIMLSAMGEEYDRIHGLELGADDYVVKPFSPRELILRLKSVIGRGKKAAAPVRHDVFEREGLCIDFAAHTVTVDGERREMTNKEFELLTTLVKNNGMAMPRERLIREIWGYDYFGDDRTLDTHMKLLRNDLGPYRRFLITIRGVGYRFEA